MSGCSVRRNQWLRWVTMPVSEWGPWGLHGTLQGKAPVSLVPHCWSHWCCPRTSLLPPRCLPCMLRWNVVLKCDLQVWELNVPLNCSVTPTVQDGQLWLLPEMGSKLWHLPSQSESLAFTPWHLRRELCPGCTGWLRGRKGGFGVAFPLRQWADAFVPPQPAHLWNQLSQRGFLLLLSNQAEVILLPSQQRRQVCLNGGPCFFKTRKLCGSSKEL